MSVFVPLADTASVRAILSHISMFGGVPVEKCSRIFEALESGLFKKDECVFRKGDEPTHIYIVKSGCIDLVDAAGTVRQLSHDNVRAP